MIVGSSLLLRKCCIADCVYWLEEIVGVAVSLRSQMSLRVKEKLDKLLHREHLGKDGKQNDIGVGQDNSAPSPVIARTSADKGDQRQHRKQGSLHNYVQNKREVEAILLMKGSR